VFVVNLSGKAINDQKLGLSVTSVTVASAHGRCYAMTSAIVQILKLRQDDTGRYSTYPLEIFWAWQSFRAASGTYREAAVPSSIGTSVGIGGVFATTTTQWPRRYCKCRRP